MSSSWLGNISGNLSSIASNVTSFTKEVLHDAAHSQSFDNDYSSQPHTQYDTQGGPYEQGDQYSNADHYQQPGYQGYTTTDPYQHQQTSQYQSQDDLVNQIKYLERQLEQVSNDNAYHSQQMYRLQTQAEETNKQHENHLNNLKQMLIEKEQEIEQLSSQVTGKEGNPEDDMSSDWNDWGEGGNNTTQELEDLKFQIECLQNDVRTKESFIRTVESKMAEVSHTKMEASKFSEWADGVVADKVKMENRWKEMCILVDKHRGSVATEQQHSVEESVKFIESMDSWLNQLAADKVTLTQENTKYSNIISTIEESVTKHSDGYESFRIDDFPEWLDSLSNQDINYIFYNESDSESSRKKLLESIELGIREFDDEDKDFKIENFAEWLEKVQCRIDDMEVEMINEVEKRETEEEQRIQERETLNDLFKQKEREISDLKVDIYNLKSTQAKNAHALNPIAEQSFEQEDLMTVHEHLNETTARCEALQHELVTAQKQNTEAREELEMLKQASNNRKNRNEESAKQMEEEKLQVKEELDMLRQSNTKSEATAEELRKQLGEISLQNSDLNKELRTTQTAKDKVSRDFESLKSKYESISSEVDRVVKDNAELNTLGEKTIKELRLQIQSLSDMHDCVKEQLLTVESSKETIQAELSETKVRYESVTQQVDHLTSELKEANNRYELLQAAETVSDSLQLQLNNLAADKDTLRTRLDAAEAAREAALLEVNEWANRHAAVTAELEETRAALSQLQARCEDLANKARELDDLQSEFDQCSVQLTETICERESLRDTNTGLAEELERISNQCLDVTQKLEKLEKELYDLRADFDALKVLQLQTEQRKDELERENSSLLETQESVRSRMGCTIDDLRTIELVIADSTKEPLQSAQTNVVLSNEPSTQLYNNVKDLCEKYMGLCKQCTELSGTLEEYQLQLKQQQELQSRGESNLTAILTDIITGIDTLLPDDRRSDHLIQQTNNKQVPTNPAVYVPYVESVQLYVQRLQQTELDHAHLKTDHDEGIRNISQQLETERALRADEAHRMNVVIKEHESNVETLKAQLKEASEQQKIEASKPATKNDGGGGGGGGGMKFGAIKRKLQELEAKNKSLIEENEQLKMSGWWGGGGMGTGNEGGGELVTRLQHELNDVREECQCYKEECELLKKKFVEMQEQIMLTSSLQEECRMLKNKLQQQGGGSGDEASNREHQNQLHNLSLMLTEKNEAIENLAAEANRLKAKLLEVENETSDLELVREECKQLKAMLVGKEHENKTEETIAMLQEESKQIKMLLIDRDAEVQHLQSALLEKENELSNMELIREECKQLKQMLVTQGAEQTTYADESAEVRAKDAEIVELRNSTSDMDLLREECRQLKQMLLEKSQENANNTAAEGELLSVKESTELQLLEAMLEDRDVQLSQKDVRIGELESKVVEMNGVEEECRHLKEIILGGGKSGSNTAVEQSHIETASAVESSFAQQVQQLEEFVKEKEEELRNKDNEVETLMERLAEKDSQISELGSEQEKYSALKDYLEERERVLVEVQDDLDHANAALEHKNRELKTKGSSLTEAEQQVEILTNKIMMKDDEITKLNVEISQSMAQDETLHLLQKEYRNVEERLRETEADLESVEKQYEDAKQGLSEALAECERLKPYVEQHSRISMQVQQKDEELCMLKLQLTERSIAESDATNTLHSQIDKLTASLQQSEEKNNAYVRELSNYQKLEVERLTMSENIEARDKIQLEKLVNEKDTLMQLCNNKDNTIKSLNDQQLSQQSQISTQTSEISMLRNQLGVFEKQLQEESANRNNFNGEREWIASTVRSIGTVIDRSINEHSGTDSITEHLSRVEAFLRGLVQSVHRKVVELSNSSESDLSNVHEGESLRCVCETLIATAERKNEESVAMFQEQESSFNLRLQDLNRQLVDHNELQASYKSKCDEHQRLEEQHNALQTSNAQLQQKNNATDPKILEEMEVMRSELERSAHLYLDKTKETDALKMEILQLEENVYLQKVEMGKLKEFENKCSGLEGELAGRDDEMAKLKSTLEDKELIVESSKREKQFLEQLLKEKEHIAQHREELVTAHAQLTKEKEELQFQKDQIERVVQEKDILLRHKDVTLKEVEAKANRELERLRNHMVMTEEQHTRDILESQDREEALQQELEDVKQGLSKKQIILQDSSKQFQEHCVDLEEQLHQISVQRDTLMMDVSACQDKMAEDASSIYNLQNALEQLQKEKMEQSDYWSSLSKRKEAEYEGRVEELTEELSKVQGAMSEASLAVQGINKLNMELQQKDNELKVAKEKGGELAARISQLETERDKILEAVDQKLDKSLLGNLLMKYFQSPEDKRAYILHVIGGLLGWSPQQLQELGSGGPPSKIGGWINNVWAYGAAPKKPSSTPATPAGTPTYDPNKSLSELFVKFLENESAAKIKPVEASGSLTLSSEDGVPTPNIHMFVSPTTPDILSSHSNGQPSDQRIPAPGQEIPRVHTHHAQSTLKSILTTTPY